MYAIVESSGRQYQLEAGRFVDIDLIAVEPSQEYVFEKVLMIVNGKDSTVGQPYVAGALVKGRVLAHDRSGKVIVYKQRPKKGTRKKQGHRQGYTRVFVESIQLADKVLSEAKQAEKPAASAKSASDKPKGKKAAASPAQETSSAAKKAKEPKSQGKQAAAPKAAGQAVKKSTSKKQAD